MTEHRFWVLRAVESELMAALGSLHPLHALGADLRSESHAESDHDACDAPTLCALLGTHSTAPASFRTLDSEFLKRWPTSAPPFARLQQGRPGRYVGGNLIIDSLSALTALLLIPTGLRCSRKQVLPQVLGTRRSAKQFQVERRKRNEQNRFRFGASPKIEPVFGESTRSKCG